MYGFHKGKKDSSKCIFSHPSFARDKEYIYHLYRSELHEIRRKFKTNEGEEEPKASISETPVKI